MCGQKEDILDREILEESIRSSLDYPIVSGEQKNPRFSLEFYIGIIVKAGDLDSGIPFWYPTTSCRHVGGGLS